MYGEIDLETYTVAIIRLNTAFEKIENSKLDDAKALLYESYKELEKLYRETIDDLNQDEVNLNEYYLFFQNGKQTFPQYIEVLGSIENEELQEVVSLLLNVFSNLNKISEGFNGDDLNDIRLG